MLRNMLRAEGWRVTGGWRKLRNEELHNLYYSIIGGIKSGKIRWARHVAHIGETTLFR
jgi:hypothetical protein